MLNDNNDSESPSDAILAIGLTSPSLTIHNWEIIPNNLWQKIITRFLEWDIDALGFRGVQCQKDISEFECFKEYIPRVIGEVSYQPYHCNIGDEESIALFDYNETLIRMMSRFEYDCWTTTDTICHTDELIFTSKGMVKVMTIPYESLMFFYNLNSKDISFIKSIDPLLADNLWSIDGKRKL